MPNKHIGWLSTFEEYYKSSVQGILSHCVNFLHDHPSMRFIWSEISFLERWERDATQDDKDKLKMFILSSKL